MTKIWLKLKLPFSQKTMTKTKLKSDVKIMTGMGSAPLQEKTIFFPGDG